MVTDRKKGGRLVRKKLLTPSYDFPDGLPHHYKMEKDRNERLGFLNDKYNLDYYSNSDSDFNSKHEYETLV